jgi:hypothetical protein
MARCHWQQVSLEVNMLQLSVICGRWWYTREARVGGSVPSPDTWSSAGKAGPTQLGDLQSFAKLIFLKVLGFRELIPVAQPHARRKR